MRDLLGKCALVTGAVGGLGHAIANRLAAEGAHVVINGLCAPDDGAAAAAAIADAHDVEAVYDPADLTVVADIERMMAAAAERFGGVDLLVNNAVVRNFSPVEKMSVAQWDTAMAVNLSAAFHTVRLALPGMKEKGWGRIVNMSSVFGWRAIEERIEYVTTKTALIGLTRAVALEAGPYGVTCNALSPGSVPTPAIMGKVADMAKAAGKTMEEMERDYISGRHPTGRFVAMENVAALVAFLASPAGADITGATLPIDGGWLTTA